MSQTIDFGVQSYCFRHFKENQVVAQKVKALGLNKIELCAAHADFDSPEAFKKVASVYQKEGVEIISLGVQTFQGNENERRWFECAALAGAKHISAHFKIESFLQAIPMVRKWSREFKIPVGIHCHGGYMFGGQPDVLKYLLDLGGPEIGLCMDTAWVMQIGPTMGNPIQWAEDFAGRITGVHFKDFTFERNGQWTDTIVGTGNLDLAGFVKALEKGGFNGVSVIEYEANPENPDAALQKCIDSMRKMVGTSR